LSIGVVKPVIVMSVYSSIAIDDRCLTVTIHQSINQSICSIQKKNNPYKTVKEKEHSWTSKLSDEQRRQLVASKEKNCFRHVKTCTHSFTRATKLVWTQRLIKRSLQLAKNTVSNVGRAGSNNVAVTTTGAQRTTV